MNLTAKARTAVLGYSSGLAAAYGVENVSEQFNISEPMENKLHGSLLDSADFLKSITYVQVPQIKGQVLKVGGHGILTGRKSAGRFSGGQDIDANKFELTKTDSCAFVTWDQLAVWANAQKPGEFLKLMKQNTSSRFALDIIRVGWNGTSAAVDTDPVANPMGEDVNIGWHQLVKTNAPDQVVTDTIYFNPDLAKDTPPKLGEYRTLDAIVTELKSMLHPSVRNDPRLRVYVGSDLVASAQSRLMNQANTPSEKVAAQMLDGTIGGCMAEIPPFFPEKRISLTLPKNLHCYDQSGTQERESKNVSDRSRHEDKWWRMEGYAVEEYEAYASIDEAAMILGAAPAA